MYIRGIGRTSFGSLNYSLEELGSVAIHKALVDADIELEEIDLIIISNFCAGPVQSQLHLNSLISDAINFNGKPVIRVETACASGGTALHQGIVSLSKYPNILILGLEKMTNSPKAAVNGIAMAAHKTYDQDNGLIFPAAYALIAKSYMNKYKLEMQDLTEVSYKNHTNANLNPYAHFYNKKITKDKINSSPIVSSPLRLYDCSPISDGACAIVLSKNTSSKRDITILASELSTGPISLTKMKDITTFPSVIRSAKKAYETANITPKDIDIACVHDCFTIAEVIAYEDLGLCEKGESKKIIRKGRTTKEGKTPVNTDGGLKADGHPIGASGLAQIYEIVTQLRGEAGTRQVNSVNIGLAHNVGGVGGTAVIHILKN